MGAFVDRDARDRGRISAESRCAEADAGGRLRCAITSGFREHIVAPLPIVVHMSFEDPRLTAVGHPLRDGRARRGTRSVTIERIGPHELADAPHLLLGHPAALAAPGRQWAPLR